LVVGRVKGKQADFQANGKAAVLPNGDDPLVVRLQPTSLDPDLVEGTFVIVIRPRVRGFLEEVGISDQARDELLGAFSWAFAMGVHPSIMELPDKPLPYLRVFLDPLWTVDFPSRDLDPMRELSWHSSSDHRTRI
jgi:hypothetical protein